MRGSFQAKEEIPEESGFSSQAFRCLPPSRHSGPRLKCNRFFGVSPETGQWIPGGCAALHTGEKLGSEWSIVFRSVETLQGSQILCLEIEEEGCSDLEVDP